MEDKVWNNYWDDLIQSNKLKEKIILLDQLDGNNGVTKRTKDICKSIYENYKSIEAALKDVESETLILLKDIENVYLQSSRVKSKDSLIVKVINRRFKYINNRNSRYNKIDEENYVDIITDLVGVRLIVSHTGDWEKVHEKLIELFPFENEWCYSEESLIPRGDEASQAMLPVAYYLDDENELRDSFKENDIIPKLSEEGYRSIHYIVTYKNYYLEIQLRPLYMEQWCMCSHNYVYKKEGYKNYNFLNNMSLILSGVIDLSGEIGDFMKDIYNGKYILQQSVNSYYMNKDGINSIDKMIEMCNNSVQDLLKLKERIELQE